MIINEKDCLFLVIDIQEKLLNAVFNKEDLEKKAKILVKTAEILNLPIFITEQYPQGLGETVDEIKNKSNVYIKTSFNALEDKNLENDLNITARKQVIIFGIETHICVYQTVCALIEKGFDVTVVSDACGSRSEVEYKYALDILRNYGAKIKTTEMIIFELIKTAKHPYFKQVQALIK